MRSLRSLALMVNRFGQKRGERRARVADDGRYVRYFRRLYLFLFQSMSSPLLFCFGRPAQASSEPTRGRTNLSYPFHQKSVPNDPHKQAHITHRRPWPRPSTAARALSTLPAPRPPRPCPSCCPRSTTASTSTSSRSGCSRGRTTRSRARCPRPSRARCTPPAARAPG